MRYLPKSPGERAEMLQQIGVASIDDLFATIPQEYRLERDLDVPRQMPSLKLLTTFAARQKTARVATPASLVRAPTATIVR